MLAKNRRANFDYEIQERLLAGIVLRGPEVKSIRRGAVSLKSAFANFMNGELWLNNMHVSPYPPAQSQNHDANRPRKLLLHQKQLDELFKQKQSGLNIVICSVGLAGGYIKAELGIGRGKKQYDKRQTIKKRQADREAAKSIRQRARP